MDNEKLKGDIARAQRIGLDLRSGRRQSMLELYASYHPFFLNFAGRRLYNPQRAEDVLSKFWMELLDGKAISTYRGENGASLRTFLIKILIRRIIDENCRIKHEKDRIKGPPVEDSAFLNSTPLDSMENSEAEGLAITLVHEALLLLSQRSPQDSNLIKMNFFEGLTCLQIADREMIEKEDHEEKLKKRAEAIKQQIHRKSTGSKAKFKVIFERLMKAKGIKYEDILKGSSKKKKEFKVK